jgi:hypothetical protein
MANKRTLVLVNFWGLGDLIATLHLIKINHNNDYHIITSQNNKVVSSLIQSFDINSKVIITTRNNRFMLALEVIKNILLQKKIVFTSPLSGNSRKFALFISIFFSSVILAKEDGNIYINNEFISNLLNVSK